MTAREIYEHGAEDGPRPKRSTMCSERTRRESGWVTANLGPRRSRWRGPGLELGKGLGLGMGLGLMLVLVLGQRPGMRLRGLNLRYSEEDRFRTPFLSFLETSQSAIDPVLLNLHSITVSGTRSAEQQKKQPTRHCGNPTRSNSHLRSGRRRRGGRGSTRRRRASRRSRIASASDLIGGDATRRRLRRGVSIVVRYGTDVIEIGC